MVIKVAKTVLFSLAGFVMAGALVNLAVDLRSWMLLIFGNQGTFIFRDLISLGINMALLLILVTPSLSLAGMSKRYCFAPTIVFAVISGFKLAAVFVAHALGKGKTFYNGYEFIPLTTEIQPWIGSFFALLGIGILIFLGRVAFRRESAHTEN